MIHSVETIVTQGLCIGCGLCKSLAGPGNVEMVMSAEGGERPVVTGTLDEPTLRLINAVCPGLHVEGYVHETGVEPEEEPPEIHPIWGPTRAMFTGHATDPDVRFHASSGGALSALGIYMIESGAVDFVLHVAASRSQPVRTVDHLSFDAVQVLEGSGSRYGPAAPLVDFKRVLDRGRPFAFVGKACDISAIRNYAKFDPRVDALLKYTMNFYCGGASEFGKTMDYVRKVGLTEPDIAHLRYRGNGCPGPMLMKSRDGQVFEFSYNEMWDDEARWQLMFRCKICPDSIGDLADITVADVWPGGKPDTEGLGFNGFIVRTKRGQTLMDGALRDGAITISHPLSYDGVEQTQGSHGYKKQSITSRLAAMRDRGLVIPEFPHLRLDQAAAMLTEAEREANYIGMTQRLIAGDNIETLPTPA
ncbi:MAG TPA: Coenzyme F420 hydrogenase/dehydrogenase, beta subunit C-terminal domain [Alphaproteobacteria bacterium]|jgi:coenzyme F420 hydrogenase subunit beta|nr:Coenzyme F420 hydrogenase/dehydrogenase, beta subunit C-terminal domain [Alphaproteobacteria bacterium]